jgi:FkbM family methyltransferase
MGLKQRLGLAYLRTSERLRPPRQFTIMANLLTSLGVEDLIDVGANAGQFGSFMRRAGYTGRILSLEPVSDAFAALQQASAGDPSWRAEQVAVGAEPGTQVMHVAGNSYSSSFLPMADKHLELAPQSAYTRDEEVTVTTVAALCEAHGIDPTKAMLKADVQGFEWAVLDGAGDALGDFAAMLLELGLLELYEGQPLLPAFIDRLDRAGQSMWNLFPAWVDKGDGRLWWADGFFVRSDLAAAAAKANPRR